jgi:hypothetical protein
MYRRAPRVGPSRFQAARNQRSARYISWASPKILVPSCVQADRPIVDRGINLEWSADVRFGAHDGLKPDIAPCRKSAQQRKSPPHIVGFSTDGKIAARSGI